MARGVPVIAEHREDNEDAQLEVAISNLSCSDGERRLELNAVTARSGAR
jgi:hypothetical protein